GGGTIAFSSNGGLSVETSFGKVKRVANDVPWLQSTNEFYMTFGNIRFDPSQLNVLGFAEGIGFWEGHLSASDGVWAELSGRDTLVWSSKTAGIEQLPSLWVI